MIADIEFRWVKRKHQESSELPESCQTILYEQTLQFRKIEQGEWEPRGKGEIQRTHYGDWQDVPVVEE